MGVDIVDRLSGSAGLVGLQWVLLSPRSRQVLRRTLESLLDSTAVLGQCHLYRAKYKPARRLNAYYKAGLHQDNSKRSSERQIAVTWSLAQDEESSVDQAGLLGMQAEAVRSGLAEPFRSLVADVPDWRMRVQIWPLDPRFPQLVRVSDPRYVRQVIAPASAASGLAADDHAAFDYAVTAIRYRPGQRHVLRYDPLDAAGRAHTNQAIFAKLYDNGQQCERAFRVATCIADWLAAEDRGVSALRPVTYLAGDAILLYPRVNGTPLTERMRHPDRELMQYVRQAGTLLRLLHADAAPGTPGAQARTLLQGELKSHSFEAELKAIARTSQYIGMLMPNVGATIKAVLDQAQVLHEQLPPEPPGFAHGDFKADHVWIAPNGLTLLDFDTCYLADQAIDVGKFLADLQFWYDLYGLPDVAEAQNQFLSAYTAGAPADRLLRARLYEALVLLKSTAHRVLIFAPDWATRTERLVNRVAAVMAALQTSFETAARPVVEPV